ncbi:hypothetical protein [Sinosporangium siamense]|uniref:Uncharacterized protein n=1 Tax=Sinosporangium siamense TaxID=1367973 RepID=A0A919V8N5_9ACTN|nr:hypothetical protein [Sinosporangium siamense]GII94426.1 hypothetical protein Ssi02_46570 [Sinosporangium siamense]
MSPALMLSSRWARDDVPGIARMTGECPGSHARAVRVRLAPYPSRVKRRPVRRSRARAPRVRALAAGRASKTASREAANEHRVQALMRLVPCGLATSGHTRWMRRASTYLSSPGRPLEHARV